MSTPDLRLSSTVLDSPDPGALAAFYERLLGYERRTDEPEWVTIGAPGTERTLSFQLESQHVRPTWPAGPGDQQMQLHLDIAVTDLVAASTHAQECGATPADFQPQDDVRVFQDPAGHPFCLFLTE